MTDLFSHFFIEHTKQFSGDDSTTLYDQFVALRKQVTRSTPQYWGDVDMAKKTLLSDVFGSREVP